MISFSICKLRKNTCFEPMRSLFSFSTAQTEKNSWKKFVKQIGEIIWWIRYKFTGDALTKNSWTFDFVNPLWSLPLRTRGFYPQDDPSERFFFNTYLNKRDFKPQLIQKLVKNALIWTNSLLIIYFWKTRHPRL